MLTRDEHGVPEYGGFRREEGHHVLVPIHLAHVPIVSLDDLAEGALSADPPLGPQDQRTLVYDTAAPMLITAGDNAKPNQVRGFARQDVC